MKRKITFVFVLILSTCLCAQTGAKLLNKAAEKMKSYDSVFSVFDYRLDNDKQNIHDVQKGTIYLKGEKYNLELMGIKQIYDGKKIYNISDEDREVTISSGKDAGILLTPTKILSAYKKGYKITMGDKKGDVQYVILTPENKSKTKKILIGINLKTENLKSVAEENNQGTRTTILLTKFVPNEPILPMQLHYDKDKYKNYLITEID